MNGSRSSFYVFPDRNDEDDDPLVQRQLDLLEGEVVASQCDRVYLFSPFSDNRQGMLGKLMCTDYRWCFVPVIKLRDPCCSRSPFLADKYDMAFASIDEMYYMPRNMGSVEVEVNSKKFRLMSAPISESEGGVSQLKICSKDFRVVMFNFKPSQFSVQLTNQIFHFAFPRKLSSLFTCTIEYSDNKRSPLSFRQKSDWERELQRTGAAVHQWRVSLFNQQFRHVESYPEFVVVPQSVLDNQLQVACNNWNGRRFPVWSWCSSNGCALLRCSELSSFTQTTEEQWKWFILGVSESHPNGLLPYVTDVTAPSWQYLASSYATLKRLCTIDTSSDFWSDDNQWYGQLEKSHWLELLSNCLELTHQVVTAIDHKLFSVIIKETNSTDMACVVCSLSQLCLDPYFRTLNGFPVLVQKEWVALSHPFGHRLYGFDKNASPDSSDGKMPVFLLFLDCVFQLLCQFPAEFEFSSTYLVSLWDVALSGLTSTFTLNSLKQSHQLPRLSSAWPLQKFYVPEHVRLFENPLCLAKKLADSVSGVRWGGVCKVLLPSFRIPELQLWLDCYLRWSPPAQIRRGGQVQRDLVLSALASQLSELQAAKNGLLTARDGIERPSPRTKEHPLMRAQRTSVSSAYPYLNETVSVPDGGHNLPVVTQQEQSVRSHSDLRGGQAPERKDLDLMFAYGDFEQTHSGSRLVLERANQRCLTLPQIAGRPQSNIACAFSSTTSPRHESVKTFL